jgi:hypothetical protein
VLRSRGVEFVQPEPEDYAFGVRVTALDPDDNRIELRQPKPSRRSDSRPPDGGAGPSKDPAPPPCTARGADEGPGPSLPPSRRHRPFRQRQRFVAWSTALAPLRAASRAAA